ncbi:hypothetical protein MSS4_01999 [Mycobacterium marinum]|uniref:hypothetical protein n=1 Tax=Mycobacterium marinum TaxID=1781 RepID=UPI000570016C|nr:hypothetical protein MSS4_01999 [Mycobacterium marinum]
MRASVVRELSAIASTGRIPLLVAGLAMGFHQSDAAGVDALQGRGVDETVYLREDEVTARLDKWIATLSS